MRVRQLSIGRARPGFTLVELLVVVSIILLLAALAVLFIPAISERQRATQAGSQLQGWLLIAKQRALRDRLPTGIRLQPGSTLPSTTLPNPLFVTDMQYVQKPDDFSGGILGKDPMFPNQVNVTAPVDFFGGQGASPDLWPVQPGDYLEVNGGGLVYLIGGVLADKTGRGATLQLVRPYTLDTATSHYRILRAPRLLQGEEPLRMPQNIAIDLSTNLPTSTPNPPAPLGGYFNPLPGLTALPPYVPPGGINLMFSPSGEMFNNVPGGVSSYYLWVRDIMQDRAAPGDMTLITIYTRTGMIAAHPVHTELNPSGTPYYLAPYLHTRDGRSSGL